NIAPTSEEAEAGPDGSARQDEAAKAGRRISRLAVAFEAGRDGFWLARWLRARGIEAYVIHATSIAVSREHRRAKTDRLDTELLKRAFIGWLRGEPNHCSMVPIPSLEEEDAKRPNCERESLVGERTRIVNRMKSLLARLGIRDFKPTLRKAPEHLATLRTAEGMQLPPNTLAELRRDMARLRFVMDQITEIEQARLDRIAQRPEEGMHAMVRVLAGVKGLASKPRTCSCTRSFPVLCGIAGLWRATPALPVRQTRAVADGARRAWPRRATPVCAVDDRASSSIDRFEG